MLRDMKLSNSQFRYLVIYFFSVWCLLTFIWAFYMLRTGTKINSMALIAIMHLLAGIFSVAIRKSI